MKFLGFVAPWFILWRVFCFFHSVYHMYVCHYMMCHLFLPFYLLYICDIFDLFVFTLILSVSKEQVLLVSVMFIELVEQLELVEKDMLSHLSLTMTALYLKQL